MLFPKLSLNSLILLVSKKFNVLIYKSFNLKASQYLNNMLYLLFEAYFLLIETSVIKNNFKITLLAEKMKFTSISLKDINQMFFNQFAFYIFIFLHFYYFINFSIYLFQQTNIFGKRPLK